MLKPSIELRGTKSGDGSVSSSPFTLHIWTIVNTEVLIGASLRAQILLLSIFSSDLIMNHSFGGK